MGNPGDRYGHIAAEKRAKISAACVDLEKWLSEKKAAQENTSKGDKPVLLCADMERKNQELSSMANEILKEPQPRPAPQQEKKPEPTETSSAHKPEGDGPPH